MNKALLPALILSVLSPSVLHAQAAQPPAAGTVPVVIWQIEREGFPTIRHAWRIGTDSLVKVTWDAGATWYGFRPSLGNNSKGMLGMRVVKRAIVENAETWAEKLAVTIVQDRAAEVTLGNENVPLSLKLSILEFRDVLANRIPAPIVGPEGTTGKEHCCATCGSTIVCDCAVCIVECHASCCVGGCECMVC